MLFGKFSKKFITWEKYLKNKDVLWEKVSKMIDDINKYGSIGKVEYEKARKYYMNER